MNAPTKACGTAISQHGLKAQNIIAGGSILYTTRTTGVGGNVATNAAVGPTSGIWWIIETQCLCTLLKIGGDDTGLYNGNKVSGTDFSDAVHTRQRKCDAATGWNAATHISKTCTSCGDRDAVARGKFENLRNHGGGTRQSNGIGHTGGKPLVARMSGAGFLIQPQYTARQSVGQGGKLSG